MIHSETSAFHGWPVDGLAFLAELERDNSREFWMGNVGRYRAALRAPTLALAAALTAEFGEAKVFRPHVDRRFRPTLDPYRADTGLTAAPPGGTPRGLVLSTRGLAVQVGWRRFDRHQLRRYRAAVDGVPGEELVAVLAALHGDGLVPDGVAALTRRPHGCPRDHPRLPLMRLRGLHVDRRWPPGDWLATDAPLERVRAAWRAARPLADWLDAHVGPRTEPPRGRPRPSVDVPTGPVQDDTADHEAAHSAVPGGPDSV